VVNQNCHKRAQPGFTLIELLVVISIIGLLASVVLVSLNQARTKSRDAARKADLRQIQTALELYYNDNGAYPCSTPTGSCSGITWMASDPGTPGTYVAGAWISGLTPNYITKLPSDPKGGSPSSYTLSVQPGCSAWPSSFLYFSDGTDYALLSHCAPENSWTSSDPFYDSVRPNWAWRISTAGSYTKGW
jgi:type II secretion system protein G